MKRRLILTLLLAIAALVTASAVPVASASASPTSTFTVVNEVGVPATSIAAIERAVTVQANGSFRSYWHTPRISFGVGGIPVYIESVAQMQTFCGPEAASCHGKTSGSAPRPYIVLSTTDGLSVNLSHEVLETLADPLGSSRIDGHVREVCDPVEDDTYAVDNVTVSDYVTPAWYDQAGTTGRTDFMRKTR